MNRENARKAPRPLDRARMEELALAYVARFSTSAAKLEDYLKRKLRERGWDGDGPAPVRATVERYVELGYIDDAAFAASRTGSLLRRGYGARRIGQALHAAGIDEETREQVRAGLAEQRQAALACARKRRLGPFGAPVGDRSAREKQVAAMLRAGHPLDSARFLVDAPSVEAAEIWAECTEED
ncbi:regulatory protein [Novosphingobium kunmingense]|uniref:Regulatory protein RecX n=1 Tax=Novosphingobium kunmingense TaxID=1211806 RepID=A0A2N0HKC6_9SPHN|nr:regulatory protein RecX [Novosphingobium kunmingense]PKB19407.1 regulatory protein [Novosphingobium kunmingense]